MRTEWASHLDRIDPRGRVRPAAPSRLAIAGNKYRAQWNVRCDGARAKFDCQLIATCPLPVRVYRVGFVGNLFPTYGDADDWTERRDAGLYADPLTPIGDRIVLTPNVDNTFYFEIDTADAVGAYALRVRIEERGETIAEDETEFSVTRIELGEEDWIYTDWIHYDAIAREHRVDLFDDGFYRVFDSYLRLYRETGGSMLMIPAFTPSLDTEPGKERTTAQLIEIFESRGRYRFDFTKFDRFVETILARGIIHLEFPPLVSQWTGEYTPKFRVQTARGEKTMFGWSTRSDDAEYLRFVDALFLALAAHLKQKNWLARAWFHLSDEPDAANADRVAKVERLMRERLCGACFFDTVLAGKRTKDGFLPIFASEDADARREAGIDVRAVYYCCEQCRANVSNRFLNMPLIRTAAIGLQMAALDAELLLHWGFNFYNEVLSRGAIDPYADATAGGNYPGGDAYIVYPDRVRGGALPSLRIAAMNEAHSVYQLLTTLKRRDPARAAELIAAFAPVAYCDRPRTVEEWERMKVSLVDALK